MADSFQESKRELYELMQRIRSCRPAFRAPRGLTPSEVRAIMAVDEMHRCEGCEDARPGRVAERMHATPSALSQTFKTLEEKGLVERRRTGGDFRGVTVTLTDEGRRFAQEGRAMHARYMDRLMEYMGEEDAAHLVRVMRKMAAFFEEDAKRGDGPCA